MDAPWAQGGRDGGQAGQPGTRRQGEVDRLRTVQADGPTPAGEHERPVVGEWVDGLDVPVLNERAVRAGAGLLFLGGFTAWMTAFSSGDVRPVRAFAVVFLVDMYLRLFAGTRFAPSLVVGGWIVRRQRPEWVAAQPKTVAWGAGVVFALASCASLGLLGLPEAAALAFCGVCLALLFLETAFGICVGCAVARRFAKEKPTLCAGDVCAYVPPRRGEQHSVRTASGVVPDAGG